LADPTFADHLSFTPCKNYADAEGSNRLYTEINTGNWAYETQMLLPDGATLISVILSSDKTELTSFTGKRSCYPVYLTIGNISKHMRRQPSMRAQRLLAYLPTGHVDDTVMSEAKARRLRRDLFHHCMRRICAPLFEPAEKGVLLADSRGVVRGCHPILAAYVADYPEQCLVTGVRYGEACPRCDILKDHFDIDECGDLRHQDDTLATIRYANKLPAGAKASVLDAAGLNDIPAPFWADWPHANIHAAITSDVLHQLIQGVGKHAVQWLITLAPARELDARIQRLPLAHGLRHFKNGISKLSNIQGSEHKAIYAQLLGCVHGIVPDKAVRAVTALLDFIYIAQYECHSDSTLAQLQETLTQFHELKSVFQEHGVRDDFKFPKLHMMQHYVESIRLFGTTDNYNTEATERLHIDLAKHAFRATNKRNFAAQMCRWLERREAIFWFATYLAWKRGKKFNARLRQRKKASKPRNPVTLAKRPDHARVRLGELRTQYGITDLHAALTPFLAKWHKVRRYRGYDVELPASVAHTLAQVSSVRTWSRVKFYTPNTQTLDAPDVLNIAFASPRHRRFDTVLIQTQGNDVAGQGGLEGALRSGTHYPVTHHYRPYLGIRVGRLRAIFKVPAQLEHALFGQDPPDHLAYVEWFTKIPAQPNRINGMFPLKRSLRPDGVVEREIVEVLDIRRACQLFPAFGRARVNRKLTPSTILDAYESFY
ncbi:hypothetical protein EXIGLDRAFT_592623, partial [Exidia glandulosa HHB12029]